LRVARFAEPKIPDGLPQPPAWLLGDGPDRDVVLSSRVRVMRNLAGHRFPHKMDEPERVAVCERIANVLSECCPFALSDADFDAHVAWRLIPAHFRGTVPGSGVLADGRRTLVCLLNEEDHLRAQAIEPGLRLDEASARASESLESLESSLTWAWSPELGFLGASPFNCGTGRRRGVLLHLVGLQACRRLGALVQAVAAQGFVARGAFGEASKVVGALLQVSDVRERPDEFDALVASIVGRERVARVQAAQRLEDLAAKAAESLNIHHMLSLPDALAILSLARWHASSHGEEPLCTVDLLLGGCEPTANAHDRAAARRRCQFLRAALL